MNIERTYKENGIKITRIAMKKTSRKSVIQGKSKRASGWRDPLKVTGVSSIYNSNVKRTGQTKQDNISSDNNVNGREWQGQ